MKAFNEITNPTFAWTQPKALQRIYELRQGSDLISTLYLVKKKGLPEATGETSEGKWTFSNSRLLHPRVFIRRAEDNQIQATYIAHLNGKGTVTLNHSRVVFYWNSADFWGTKWEFTDSERKSLMQLKPEMDFVRLNGQLTLSPSAIQIPQLPVLILLGWYLVLLANYDARQAIVPIPPLSTGGYTEPMLWDLFED